MARVLRGNIVNRYNNRNIPKMEQHLYFIAIEPPQRISGEVRAFEYDFAWRFGSFKAIKAFPHITLKIPFKLATSAEGALRSWFRKLYRPVGPFPIELDGFGAFEYNRVIFIQPKKSTPLLQLQHEVIRSFHIHHPEIKISSLEKNFHPHMTVAYRDLAEPHFASAWNEYRHMRYRASFTTTELGLYRHNTQQWERIATVQL